MKLSDLRSPIVFWPRRMLMLGGLFVFGAPFWDGLDLGCEFILCPEPGVMSEMDVWAREFNSAREDIASLLEGILAGRPPDRPESFLRLCEEAVCQSDDDQDADIEEWAKRLAEDLSKFTD